MANSESKILILKKQLSEELKKEDSDNSLIISLSSEIASLDEKLVRFSVDAGIINRLGKELVGRHETAVSELVKNAYDAEVTECNLDDIKDPVNPFVSIEDFDIPEGLDAYETSLEITIPDGDSNGKFDEGDYHFFISLVDKEGWSTQKGLSVKIFRR